MNKPLLLVFHPDLNQSKVNRALVQALKRACKLFCVSSIFYK